MRNEKLIEARNSRNETQEEVATNVGISRAMYAMMEIGDRSGTYFTLKRVADYFDSTVDELFGEHFRAKNAHILRHGDNTA